MFYTARAQQSVVSLGGSHCAGLELLALALGTAGKFLLLYTFVFFAGQFCLYPANPEARFKRACHSHLKTK